VTVRLFLEPIDWDSDFSCFFASAKKGEGLNPGSKRHLSMGKIKRSFTKASISEPAFVALVSAALEAYDKETLGAIMGTVYKKKILIKHAVAYQCAIRKLEEVSIWPAKEKKIRDAINALTGYKILGDFHSHPDWTCVLSKHDKADMIENGTRISVLISVGQADGNKIPWGYDKDEKFLYGTLRGDFLLNIRVYARELNSKRIYKVPIDCPFVTSMNKKALY